MIRTALTVLTSTAVGAAAAWIGLRRLTRRRSVADPHIPVTRVTAHLSSSASRFTPARSQALRRDVQEVYESKEAAADLEMLDRLLIDIRDMAGADEAIFWRWVEPRRTLVPNAWSTEHEPRPVFFNLPAWGPILRWSAEERLVQTAGDDDDAPVLAAAPVFGPDQIYGVLSVSRAGGLAFDRHDSRTWLPRFSAQVASLLQLFDLRRAYGRQMRQSGALLDAVRRLNGHRSIEALAEALCETARDVTSASIAGIVRWNAADQHGVVQAISDGVAVEPGFHVTADSLVGRVCGSKLPMVLEDAAAATAETCPYGGITRPIGSLAIVPVMGAQSAIGALIVEGKAVGAIGHYEGANVGLLAAIARGPLEIVWEIEEVSKRARTDGLTGLANRRHFDEQLRRVIAETDRFGGTCSLILVDLDHFKQINDTHGHEAGDTVLRHVALVLGDAVRTVDVCARFGGEEIAVLLPQTSQAGALELAERLRSTLERRPTRYNGQPIRATASLGVATYPLPVANSEQLLVAADRALYDAKGSGRNCVRFVSTSGFTSTSYSS
jgi:diguanylate cyclase (GGDEF)-like protein